MNFWMSEESKYVLLKNRVTTSRPVGSKKEMFKCRSVNNIVIPAAKTGSERKRRTAVIPTDQANKDVFSIVFLTVLLKLKKFP